MNISTFKRLATLTHDNTNIAMSNWSKTMGLGCWGWRSLWAYKEYVYTYGGVKYTCLIGEALIGKPISSFFMHLLFFLL